MKFKELRENLHIQPIAFKRYMVENMKVVVYKEGNSYTVSIDGTKLDEEFDNVLEAEDAVKDFAELLSNEE